MQYKSCVNLLICLWHRNWRDSWVNSSLASHTASPGFQILPNQVDNAANYTCRYLTCCAALLWQTNYAQLEFPLLNLINECNKPKQMKATHLVLIRFHAAENHQFVSNSREPTHTVVHAETERRCHFFSIVIVQFVFNCLLFNCLACLQLSSLSSTVQLVFNCPAWRQAGL